MSGKKHVLVICRTPAGQMYLGVLLNRIWYAPTLIKSAAEAARIADENPFSLVILDGDMPDEELYSAVSLLRSDASLKTLPLVVFISRERNHLQEILIGRGCSAVVTKPLDLAMVYGILSRLSSQPRTSPRVPVRMKVTLLAGDEQRTYMSVNISESGIYVRTHTPLQEKTEVDVSFTLPKDAEELTIHGEVVRTMPLSTEMSAEPGMAIRFIDPGEEVVRRIRNFVQWELMGDLEWETPI